MIFQISHGTAEFADKAVFSDLNFEIRNKNDKIAVVGRNGCGKSSLLRLISGEISLSRHDGDEGSGIFMTGSPKIGYLKQISFENGSLTLDDEIRGVFKRILDMKERIEELVELMNDESYVNKTGHKALVSEYTRLRDEFQDIGGYYYEKEYDIMLKSFGFSLEDKEKKLSEFSGGQRTKLAFIKLLLSKPDILLLDEPTNHLDIGTVEWLEGYIRDYKKAVVIVSHDRMFLDRTVDHVYEIEHGKCRYYPGNYSDFVKRKKEYYIAQQKKYDAQQKEIERLESLAERFMAKASKTSMAKSKLKAIEHMELIDAPDKYDDRSFRAAFEPAIETGKDVLYAKDLVIGYDKALCSVSLDIKRGTRLGIIGGNGIGKSTLVKTLAGIIKPVFGQISYGANVEIGYFDQEMAGYESNKSVLDDFWDEYPMLSETEARNCLGAFLFSKDEVFKDVGMLSGGEKVRLSLAKIFKRRPNVLILDEPTNHMDIAGRETLASMLKDFAGTVIFVSHDRYFVRQVADAILAMDDDGAHYCGFGYDYYEEKIKKQAEDKAFPEDMPAKGRSSISSYKDHDREESRGMASYKQGKEQARNEKKLKKMEDMIACLEDEIEAEKTRLTDPSLASDYMELYKIQKGIDEKEEELIRLMEEWDSLS